MSTIPRRFPAPVSDQAMYLAHSFHNAQGHLIVRLSGCLDAVRLARAVRLTLDAEPVLGCRFVTRPFHPYWERRQDLDSLALCPVFETGDDAQMWRFVSSRLDSERDGLVRVGVFRNTEDTLCLKLDHMLADAAGLLDYSGLLATIYVALGQDPAYVPEPNLGSRSFRQVLRTVRLGELLAAAPRPAPNWSWHLRLEPPDRNRGTYAIEHIEPRELSCLGGYCRQAGVTLTDVLLAAYYRGLWDVLRPRAGTRLPMGVPVNLRRVLPDKRAAAICNLSSMAYIAIPHRPGVPFHETLADVQIATMRLRSRLVGLDSVVYLKLLFASGFALPQYVIGRWGSAVNGTAGFGLANIGVLSPEQVSFGEVQTTDLCPVGPLSYAPSLVLTTSTFGGRMTISAGYCQNGEKVDAVQCVVGRMRDELLELAQHGW